MNWRCICVYQRLPQTWWLILIHPRCPQHGQPPHWKATA